MVDDTWHHFVAIIISSTTSSNTATFYLDGQFVGTVTGGVQGLYKPKASGVYTIGELGDNWECINGVMDDVRIYNRALTAAEVAALYSQ